MRDFIEIRTNDKGSTAASGLDEIAREGARRMLAQALEAEVADYMERHQERDEHGRAQVVRNGKARPRKVTLGSGTIEVRAPRVDDRRESDDGSRRRFHSQILPKAVASLRRDEAELLAFFDFPAEHWLHLRTGSVIESPFATVRLRQRVTKGAGSRQKGLLMAFQLLAMAEQRWRRINGAHLIPLVRAGLLFSDGVQPEKRNAA